MLTKHGWKMSACKKSTVNALSIINHVRSTYAAFSVCVTFWEVLSLCLDFSLYIYNFCRNDHYLCLPDLIIFSQLYWLIKAMALGLWVWGPTTLSYPGTTPRVSSQEPALNRLALFPLETASWLLPFPLLKTISSHFSCSVLWSLLYIKI